MKRWIFNITAVVSLLLLLATVGLWVDGYYYASLFSHESTESSTGVLSERGILSIGLDRTIGWAAKEPGWSFGRLNKLLDTAALPSEFYHSYALGFGLNWGKTPHSDTYLTYGVCFPHWILTLIFAVLPAIWFVQWRKRRRLASIGNCPSCGYDLTANTTGVCPECGEGVEGEAT